MQVLVRLSDLSTGGGSLSVLTIAEPRTRGGDYLFCVCIRYKCVGVENGISRAYSSNPPLLLIPPFPDSSDSDLNRSPSIDRPHYIS